MLPLFLSDFFFQLVEHALLLSVYHPHVRYLLKRCLELVLSPRDVVCHQFLSYGKLVVLYHQFRQLVLDHLGGILKKDQQLLAKLMGDIIKPVPYLTTAYNLVKFL